MIDRPIWMPLVFGELGVRETPGVHATPRILEYFKATQLQPSDDVTPWCSAFACWSLERTGLKSTHSARALSWRNWGNQCGRRFGAICVLSRDNNPELGHVCFFLEEDATRFWVIGGNQGDAVSVRSFPLERLLATRWPGEFEGRA